MSNPEPTKSEPSKPSRNAIVAVVLAVAGAVGYGVVSEMTKDAYNGVKEAARNGDLRLPGGTCRECGGTGQVEVMTNLGGEDGVWTRQGTCSVCQGTGVE